MTKNVSLSVVHKRQRRLLATWDGRTLLTTPDGQPTEL